MRISDWSSDVCSSDLLELKTAISGVPLAEFGGEIEGHVARLCRRPGLEFVAGLGERGLAARAIAELTGQILAHLDATLAGADGGVPQDRKSTRLNSSH